MAKFKNFIQNMKDDNVYISESVELNSDNLIEEFQYAKENVIGSEECRQDFESEYFGCACMFNCDLKSCTCLANNCALKNISDGEAADDIKHYAIECNKNCCCSESCSNRNVQNGIQIPLEIFITGQKGLGVRPKSQIPKSTFVCEYAGEIISLAKAKKRVFKNELLKRCNYILTVQEHHVSFTCLSIVDPMFKGNVGRFINHSCNPNLYMDIIRVDNLVPKFCLFSKYDIEKNEELTYDYSGYQGNKSSDSLSKTECFCQSANCRKFLPCNETVINST